MREIDRRAIEEYGISAETLMENAGEAVARSSMELLERLAVKKPWSAAVCCGGGNNGGDGLVAARLFKKDGMDVKIIFLKPAESLKGAALANFVKIKEMVPYESCPSREKFKNDLANSSLVIDSLLGTGFKGNVEGTMLEAIEIINRTGKPVVSVDIPSGMDGDTGKSRGTCVRAHLTVTLGAMKKGFIFDNAKKFTGQVIVADIGFPKELIERR